MRNTEERLAAVQYRALEIEAKRYKRQGLFITFAALAASLLIIVGLSFLIPSVLASSPAADYSQPGAAASVFDASSSLGYILIGILAFALGVAITILFYRIRVKNKEDQDQSDGRAKR